MDISVLKRSLENLTGKDYALAERKARRKGETAVVIQLASSFQAELAALALGMTTDELEKMPIRVYNAMMSEVSNFLFQPLEEAALLMEPEEDTSVAKKSTKTHASGIEE